MIRPTLRFAFPFLLLFFWPGASAFGQAASQGWVAFEVPADREIAAVQLLESGGVTAIAWSNALVEVSAYDRVETRPLASLETSLTPWDPRWDPWLIGIKPSFLSKTGTSQIWVEAGQKEEARRLLGNIASAAGLEAPLVRRVTGWLLVAFSLLYLIFRLGTELRSGPKSQPRAVWWIWLPLTLVVLSGGIGMTLGKTPSSHDSSRPPVSWLHHLWFQGAWPYGASWGDWNPGKAWTYPSFERHDGRIVEGRTALEVPAKAWAEAAYESLDRHQAARIFPPENP